jgi:hypothetical protein
MHNIYITLSHLHSINELIILWYITIQDISKIELKFKGSIDMVTSTSKHDITKEKYKHCMLKIDKWKKKNHDRRKFWQRHNDDDVIDYCMKISNYQ